MELNSLYSRFYSTKERIATATHVVSYWWLPGGYDVVHAHVRFAFFDNELEAQQFAERYEDRPHLASLMTRAAWDEMVSRRQLQHAEETDNE